MRPSRRDSQGFLLRASQVAAGVRERGDGGREVDTALPARAVSTEAGQPGEAACHRRLLSSSPGATA